MIVRVGVPLGILSISFLVCVCVCVCVCMCVCVCVCVCMLCVCVVVCVCVCVCVCVFMCILFNCPTTGMRVHSHVQKHGSKRSTWRWPPPEGPLRTQHQHSHKKRGRHPQPVSVEVDGWEKAEGGGGTVDVAGKKTKGVIAPRSQFRESTNCSQRFEAIMGGRSATILDHTHTAVRGGIQLGLPCKQRPVSPMPV
jgi:hypothetical protein